MLFWTLGTCDERFPLILDVLLTKIIERFINHNNNLRNELRL